MTTTNGTIRQDCSRALRVHSISTLLQPSDLRLDAPLTIQLAPQPAHGSCSGPNRSSSVSRVSARPPPRVRGALFYQASCGHLWASEVAGTERPERDHRRPDLGKLNQGQEEGGMVQLFQLQSDRWMRSPASREPKQSMILGRRGSRGNGVSERGSSSRRSTAFSPPNYQIAARIPSSPPSSDASMSRWSRATPGPSYAFLIQPETREGEALAPPRARREWQAPCDRASCRRTTTKLAPSPRPLGAFLRDSLGLTTGWRGRQELPAAGALHALTRR